MGPVGPTNKENQVKMYTKNEKTKRKKLKLKYEISQGTKVVPVDSYSSRDSQMDPIFNIIQSLAVKENKTVKHYMRQGT